VADKRPAKDREHADPGAGFPAAPAPPVEEATDGLTELLEPVAGPAGEVQERRARLAEDRLSEVLDAYRQLKTENETFRERTTRNLERRFEQRHERLLLKFIEIMDNLDRALEAAQVNFASAPLVEGLILVRTQLLQTLKEEGLERIPVLGLPFDPHVSEAVGTQAVSEAEHHNVVVKELERGWRLKDRIARPSKVVLGEYRDGEAAAEASGAEPAGPAAAPETEPSLEDIISRTEAEDAAVAPPTPVRPAAPSPVESLLDGLLDEPPSEEPEK
jgi:molecular chaperone GrpE